MSTPETVKTTATAMRRELRTHFPTTRFSVRCVRGTGHGWIDVQWVDGPSVAQVQALTHQFQSSQFDGMDDSYHSTGNTRWSCRGVSHQRDFSDQARALADSMLAVNEPDRFLAAYRWMSARDLSDLNDVKKAA